MGKVKTKNKLSDLNNHLFEALERLNDSDLNGQALEDELSRAKGIAQISSQIIANANTVLKAARFADERIDADSETPQFLLGE